MCLSVPWLSFFFFFHSQDQSLFNLAAAGCNSCCAQGLCIPRPNFHIGPGNFYMCILYHSHRLCSHLCARLQVKNLTSCFWAVWSLTTLIFGAWHWLCCISTIDCWLYTHTFTEDYGTKRSDSMHSSLVYRVKMRSVGGCGDVWVCASTLCMWPLKGMHLTERDLKIDVGCLVLMKPNTYHSLHCTPSSHTHLHYTHTHTHSLHTYTHSSSLTLHTHSHTYTLTLRTHTRSLVHYIHVHTHTFKLHIV